MPKEFFYDEDETRCEWVRPDESGFTVRTQYKGTQGVLDRAAILRADTSKNFRDAKGVNFHHIGSIPNEVYEREQVRLGRPMTSQECVELLKSRDFSKLRTRDVRL